MVLVLSKLKWDFFFALLYVYMYVVSLFQNPLTSIKTVICHLNSIAKQKLYGVGGIKGGSKYEEIRSHMFSGTPFTILGLLYLC